MLKVLVLCTGNSCRSILGEALINQLGGDRFQAFSAGSHPAGKVNADALATLARHGIPTDGFSSQSWDEFDQQSIDIAITVCDNAAGEVCPVYLNDVIRAHWGLPDPAHISGSPEVIEAAFEATYAALEKRVRQLLELSIETMPRSAVTEVLNKIGAETS
jgi:arsenate reductase